MMVDIESAMGEGTTLKKHPPANPDARTNSSTPPFLAGLPRGCDELVLVVEDEFAIRDITQHTLESFGYRVITADNGVEAVDLYAKEAANIALVLTDLMMPVMDGAEAIKLLRRINPSVKIIVFSALELPRELKPSVQGFMAKPYTAETLTHLVRDVLAHPAVTAS